MADTAPTKPSLPRVLEASIWAYPGTKVVTTVERASDRTLLDFADSKFRDKPTMPTTPAAAAGGWRAGYLVSVPTTDSAQWSTGYYNVRFWRVTSDNPSEGDFLRCVSVLLIDGVDAALILAATLTEVGAARDDLLAAAGRFVGSLGIGR